VPPGITFPGSVNPSGALGHLAMWPTGQTQPVVSTLNSFLGTVVANAAIVPAGTAGSVDVFVSNTTDLIIDINGYYAAQSGITLAQGTAASPSLSFAGDSGTGIFSSGNGVLNVAAGGANRLSISSGGNVGIGADTPEAKLHVAGAPEGIRVQGQAVGDANNAFVTFYDASGTRIGYVGDGSDYDKSVALDSDSGDVVLNTGAGRVLTATSTGRVGIGTTNPLVKLHVEGGTVTAVYGHTSDSTGYGVYGNNTSSPSAQAPPAFMAIAAAAARSGTVCMAKAAP